MDIYFYPGYDCLLSYNSTQSEESVSCKIEEINEARKCVLRKCNRNSVVRLGWGREWEVLLCLSGKKNATNLLEVRAEAIDTISAEPIEETPVAFWTRRRFVCLLFVFRLHCVYRWKQEIERLQFTTNQTSCVDCSCDDLPDRWGKATRPSTKMYANIHASIVTVAIRYLVGRFPSFLNAQNWTYFTWNQLSMIATVWYNEKAMFE